MAAAFIFHRPYFKTERLPFPEAFLELFVRRRLTLAELEALTSLLATELFTFHGARIASHQSFFLQSGLVLGVVCHESAGNAQTNGAHLAGDSATMSVHFDIPLIRIFQNGERKIRNHILHIGVEIILKIATIDGALAGTRFQDNSSDGVFATTGATVDLFRFCGSNSVILRPRNRLSRFRGVGPRAAVPHQRRF